jgi:hypothetical protein
VLFTNQFSPSSLCAFASLREIFPSPLRFRSFHYRAMLTNNGITLSKTSSNSPGLFVPATSRMRMRWMYPGAVLNPALGITVLFGSGR